jgi:hypothetical protein
MGDASAAFPTEQTAFFYNPAHLGRVAPLRPHIHAFGFSASLSSGAFDQIELYRERLSPAIDRGLYNLPDDELAALYEETLDVSRRRSFISGDALLPAMMGRIGPVGVGGGLFAHSLVRYHAEGTGAAVPFIHLAGQVDLIAVGAGALDLSLFGVTGLTAGLTSRYTWRYLSIKAKPLDAIDSEENLYLFTGRSLGVDAGFLYEPGFLSLPGRLNVGMVLYDLVATDFDYTFEKELKDGKAIDETVTIAAEKALIRDQYELRPSFRAGVAYTVPSLGGLLKETGFSLDYLGYPDPFITATPFVARLHLGVQTHVTPILALRAGINQGYPTFGGGLALGFMRLDYAFFGAEHGRVPGQLPSWSHTLQVAFGIF